MYSACCILFLLIRSCFELMVQYSLLLDRYLYIKKFTLCAAGSFPLSENIGYARPSWAARDDDSGSSAKTKAGNAGERDNRSQDGSRGDLFLQN
ncbi:MAG TPA: hypothetical protein DCZ69_12355, partial [Syntrophobacteraceae bacterium]|nr:hypothetical protein [Syntrophobacteraceae bacterium]